MTEQDLKPFIGELLRTADYFGAELSATAQRMYFEGLADLEFAAVRAAFRSAIRACKFMPKVAEIRELAEGSPEDRGQRAWAQLQQAAKSIGGYASVRLEDPATAAALVRTFGSWVRFCTMELDPPMWANKRKEFLLNYRIAQRQPADLSLLGLPGHAEIHNRETVALWGAGHDPMAQRRGLLSADGTVSSEPMAINPADGRLLPATDVRLLTGTVEPPGPFVNVAEELAVRHAMAPAIAKGRGVCPSCGATWKDEIHGPACEVVQSASEHEARVRRQAMALVASSNEPCELASEVSR